MPRKTCKQFYYAVHKGRKPGVYSDWKTCEPFVHKFKGAVCKKFSTKKEAEYFLQNGSLIQVTQCMETKSNKLHSSLVNQVIVKQTSQVPLMLGMKVTMKTKPKKLLLPLIKQIKQTA